MLTGFNRFSISVKITFSLHVTCISCVCMVDVVCVAWRLPGDQGTGERDGHIIDIHTILGDTVVLACKPPDLGASE